MSLKIVHTDKAPAAIGPYSQGVVANGFLYTAGQIAIDPATGQVMQGDVGAQTERVMSNLAAVLATVNATWKDVVKTTIFLQDMSDFPIVNEVYGARARRRAAGAIDRAGAGASAQRPRRDRGGRRGSVTRDDTRACERPVIRAQRGHCCPPDQLRALRRLRRQAGCRRIWRAR